MRRAGREALGDRARFPHQVLIVDGAIDHPPGCGLFRANRIGEHHQRPGARFADQARQDKGAARVGNEADARERLQELSRLRRQHDVAGEREIGPGPRRWAVDRAHDRLRKTAKRAHQRIEALVERLAEIGSSAARTERAVGEVRPGAEPSAGAGDENRAARGIRRRALEPPPAAPG